MKTITVPRAEAKLFLGKAEQFLAEARSALESARFDAASLNAVHAGISAGDAVAVALAGRRSRDPDHHRAVDLLEQVAGASSSLRSHARQLRTLLSSKNIVEYESRRSSQREAADAIRRAERLVGWAAGVIEAANL